MLRMDMALWDMLPVVICETAAVRDASGKLIDLEWTASNRLMNESIRSDGKSIVGMRIFEFDAAYKNSEMVRAVTHVIETGESRTFHTSAGRAAQMLGKVMKTTIIPVEREGERRALSVSHEVTELAQERDEALRLYELAKTACDNALHGIILNDTAGRIIYVNRALCEMSEFTEEELIGKDVGILTGDETYEPDAELAMKLASGEMLRHVTQAETPTKSGGTNQVELSLTSARWGERGERIFITYVRDIREERRKAHELRDALNRAEQGTRLKSEFLANMSHEIRTPLNGVLGMTQVLAHTDLTPDQKEQVATILDSGKTLMSILNDILDLSKIEAGKLEVTPVTGDLRHKLSRMIKLHAATAEEKGINLQLFIDPSVPSRMKFDPVRVRQCVGNLVSNAIKFTEKGDVMVVVTCEPTPSGSMRVIVHVTDSGCGIPADKIDRVFESFSQADGSTTRRFGGTGLGLPITRKLAQMMGGDVTVVSEPGRGSVFTLKFEAESSDVIHLHEDVLPKPVAPKSSRDGLGGRRALVVDDNGINRRVARTFLEHYGLEVSEAGDGNEALEALDHEPFDIVLMDIHMPGLDGAEAFKRLRNSASLNRVVPVIALTADSMRGDREKYLAKGFDGYVAKPIDERSLVTVIGQVLSIPTEFGERRARA
ncbi:sensory box sensor histidine kinase/response regulator [Hyphomonas jannaschiana VP2]|uniref:Sensory/regulatory protein RpfC n=2 Tax=Hyphomonas jannaschiana TaxID=86 RepID=A0A059FKU3_9PROT|nr:sensory box sensor histidine kinase/response regulator [Hyphomonas jannaschiana VP2]